MDDELQKEGGETSIRRPRRNLDDLDDFHPLSVCSTLPLGGVGGYTLERDGREMIIQVTVVRRWHGSEVTQRRRFCKHHIHLRSGSFGTFIRIPWVGCCCLFSLCSVWSGSDFGLFCDGVWMDLRLLGL